MIPFGYDLGVYIIFKYLSMFLLVTVCSLLYVYRASDMQIFEGQVFGTYYSIKAHTNKEVHNQIKQKYEDINQKMSVFTPNSEINLVNKSLEVNVSDELFDILKVSKKVWQETSGAFDPTMGQLIELWGFGANKTHSDISQAKITTVLQYSGFDKVNLEPNKVSKKDIRTRFNLSAIAKGYAVDEIAKILDQNGVENYLVDIGGEISAKGYRDKKSQPWKIGLATPLNPNKNALVLELENMAVATSGDYYNFFVKDGKKYSHTINPKTGRPVEHNLASVTVFNSSTMLADAYATALMVMGEDEGIKFAKKHHIKAIFFNHNGEISYAN